MVKRSRPKPLDELAEKKSYLTPKQLRFVQEWLVDCNATRAAIRAGYSPRCAKEQGYQNLTKLHVAEAIEIERARRAAETEATKERVLLERRRIAYADPRRAMKWGADGVTLLESDEIDDATAAAISEVSQTVTKDGGSIKIKFHDKNAALEAIAKMQGYNAAEKHEHTGANGGPLFGSMTDEALLKRREELRARHGLTTAKDTEAPAGPTDSPAGA